MTVSPSAAGTHGAGAGLVCTVTTLRDTRANAEAFVRRNLAAGADHLFVFLDAPDPDTHRYLRAEPSVTVRQPGKRYWRGERPRNLNTRQVTNANLVNTLLAVAAPEVRWLFHLDGDECLDLDRTQLLGLPGDVDAVRLGTREAVSRRHWDHEVDRFKEPLDRDQLCLLTSLGVIDRPSNSAYYNGHVAGKPGLRPSVDRRLRIHAAEEADGAAVAPHEADWLHVLHYESYSGEEFVRKWMAHLASGHPSKVSAHRDQLRAAVRAVLQNSSLTAAGKAELLSVLYRRHVEDREDLLSDLGYLTGLRPELHLHRPQPFGPLTVRLVRRLWPHLWNADKSYFDLAETGPRPRRELLADVRRQLAPEHRGLERRLDRVLSSGGDERVDATKVWQTYGA